MPNHERPDRSSGAPHTNPIEPEDHVKKSFTAPSIRLESALTTLTQGLTVISGTTN